MLESYENVQHAVMHSRCGHARLENTTPTKTC